MRTSVGRSVLLRLVHSSLRLGQLSRGNHLHGLLAGDELVPEPSLVISRVRVDGSPYFSDLLDVPNRLIDTQGIRTDRTNKESNLTNLQTRLELTQRRHVASLGKNEQNRIRARRRCF